MRNIVRVFTLFLTVTFLSGVFLWAYPVGPSFNFEQLNTSADVIVKVVAGESSPLTGDDWFEEVSGFRAVSTNMRVISVIKGELKHADISFRHFTSDEDTIGHMYMPQHYSFETGRPYIVLAKKTDDSRVIRQIWKHHKSKEDQGVLLASSANREFRTTLKEVYWHELTGFLSKNVSDVEVPVSDIVYAIDQLDRMSGGARFDRLKHFDRLDVLQEILPLLDHADTNVATAAINLMACDNPYKRPDNNPFWLATIGEGHVPGFSKYHDPYVNLGGILYWKDLVAIANGNGDAKMKAMAIRALGTGSRPEVWPHIGTWLADGQIVVREAAVVLLADYPGEATTDFLAHHATSESAAIRAAVAQAIGYGQFHHQVDILETMLDDEHPAGTAAALSLLSLPVEHIRDTLIRNVDHRQFRSLFINVLAMENPGDYFDELGEIIREDLRPTQWWGGQIPWGNSWDILFEFARTKGEMALQGGECDQVLDILECPINENLETAKYFGSQRPRDLYELYLEKGLSDRAAAFREVCIDRLSFNIDYYFQQVDKRKK